MSDRINGAEVRDWATRLRNFQYVDITSMSNSLDDLADQMDQDAAKLAESERTVKSLAVMLGWENVPPRETLERSVSALKARLAEVERERAQWQHAAFSKIRLWEVLQSMHRAGDSLEELAKGYDLPLCWVEFVMFPENDLDARYGRPSDRTKTTKAEALDLNRRVSTLSAALEQAKEAICSEYCGSSVHSKQCEAVSAALAGPEVEQDRDGLAHSDRLIRADLAAYVTDCSTPTFQLVRNCLEHVSTLSAALERFKLSIEAMQEGTRANGGSKRERFEVETIQKTLNVVLSELAAALAGSEVEQDRDRLIRHDADCRCQEQETSGVGWTFHTLCSLRREYAEEHARHMVTMGELTSEVTRRREAEDERDALRAGILPYQNQAVDLTARSHALEAQVANWERKEVQRGSCCSDNEARCRALAAALERAAQTFRDFERGNQALLRPHVAEANRIAAVDAEAALAGSEMGKEIDAWVSVVDRLPALQAEVLVRTNKGRVTVAYRCAAGTIDMDSEADGLVNEDGMNAQDGWFATNPDRDPEDWWINDSVTHWMPIPAAARPEDKETTDERS
jgi:hypothetical protein